MNLKDYIIESIEDGEVLKMPGAVNGQQFVIQNCKNTSIFVFDHANTVTVDDCINCKIILAAVKGRYFVDSCLCFCPFSIHVNYEMYCCQLRLSDDDALL